jgi:enamine deaminase RidA (YjgF/YER057c/UK114 family)
MRNVLTVLAAAGTGPEHVVKLNIYLVDGVDAQVGYAASRSVWGDHRTAITVVSTAGLSRGNAFLPHLRRRGHAPSHVDAIEASAATGQRQTLG